MNIKAKLVRASCGFLLLFFAARAGAQDVKVDCTQNSTCTLTPAGGIPWSNGNLTWVFKPLNPRVSVYIFIHNLNPTSAHTSQTIQVFQSPFSQDLAPSLSNSSSSWTQDTVTQNANAGASCNNVNPKVENSPGASGLGTCYVTTMFAAQVAIRISGASSASGSPDNFELAVVQETGVPGGQTPGSSNTASPAPPVPDCKIQVTMTAAGRSAAFDNRTTGCISWGIYYFANNASSISLELDNAGDNNGSPGSWTIFHSMSALTNTSYTDQNTQFYSPWVSINLNSIAGAGATVTIIAIGYRQSLPVTVFPINAGPGTPGYDFEAVTIFATTQFAVGDGTPNSQMALGAPSNNMNVNGAALMVGPLIFNGTSWDRMRGSGGATAVNPVQPSTLKNAQTTSAANTAQTSSTAGSAGQRVYLYSLAVQASASATCSVTVKDGVAGTVIWSSDASFVTVGVRTITWPVPLTSSTGNGMDVVVSACGSAVTSTLAVQESQW